MFDVAWYCKSYSHNINNRFLVVRKILCQVQNAETVILKHAEITILNLFKKIEREGCHQVYLKCCATSAYMSLPITCMLSVHASSMQPHSGQT